MRLAVSNLAWPNDETGPMLELLAGLGVQAIEVAPTRIASWEALTPQALRRLRARCEGAGLVVSSMQSILYGLPELQLVDQRESFERLHEHIRTVCGLGEALGARVMVFGAPANRRRGSLPPSEAMALAAERLARLGVTVAAAGMVIALEPVPRDYGADFLERAKDVERLVRCVSHPAIRVHLDTACAMLAGDDIATAIGEASSCLAHFHAAEPDLGGFAAPRADHPGAGRALAEHSYRGFVAIEMREAENPGPAITQAVRFVQESYGPAALAG